MLEQFKTYYTLAKEKKIDTRLIQVGLAGVVIGWLFSITLINQVFAWLILIGVCIKLYDFTEKIEREMVPYDFNSLLPPPSKKDKQH